ncbi:Bax inhibitor-1/YccA family membrane protein [Planosporangium sp. 12N6]|uniref:Bax inhibitor-1/YccA family protein n=1 Tax=Planosporangium spinosum TaxID=3402278 RepID=UPI003CEEA093
MQSSNPVLTRLGEAASHERAGGYGPLTTDRMMSLDDVVVRTVGLVLLTAVSAALSWNLLTDGPVVALAAIGSVIAGLVLGLVISFARITNPLVIGAYAVIEGVLLGMVSRYYEHFYGGIVIQAVIGTLGVFVGMAMLYKARVLRATPKFTRFVVGAMIGVAVMGLVNWIVAMVSGHSLLVQYSATGQVGPIPIIFSLVAIGVGALTFILDFDQVEQGVRYGLPEKYSWYCAFGLLVGLIFLYWQILRLLSYLRR